MSPAVLERLGLVGEQSGATDGAFGWSVAGAGGAGSLLTSTNPATGAVLGRVRAATADDYDRILAGEYAVR